ncbi:hypothetical protein KAX06_01705 [candidate division WOR-3 bacterium]|nr:hypothetical protein [candidate division WOR-3 bacterium]
MSDQTLLSIIALIVGGLGTMGVIITAVVALKNAGNSRQTIRFSVIDSLLSEYSSPEMNEAMKALGKWYDAYHKDENWPQKFRELRVSGKPEDAMLDNSRRKFSHYEYRIHRLYRAKVIDLKMVKDIASVSNVSFLKYIIKPLEIAINPEHYDNELFKFFESLYGEEETRKDHESLHRSSNPYTAE